MEYGQLMKINALYVIIKLVERCNLNCSYCYYYTPENAEVFTRASLMSDEHLGEIISYVENAVDQQPIRRVVFSFHGGEPTLAKAERVRKFCDQAKERLKPKLEVNFALQTNGVHLSDAWLALIADEGMGVGISIDGDKAVHDRHRVDHAGQGSYDRIRKSLNSLLPLSHAGKIRLTALAVMGKDFTGIDFYRHIVDEIGIRNIKLLFEDRTSDMPPTRNELVNLGHMLKEIFDYWILHDRNRVEVTLFQSAVRDILASGIRRRTIEDGITAGLAVLSDGRVRIPDDYMVATGWFKAQETLFLSGSTFSEYMSQASVQEIISSTIQAPEDCQSCSFVSSCAGGEIAHRHTRSHGFNGKSVYCSALMDFYGHVAMRLDDGRAELARASAKIAAEIA